MRKFFPRRTRTFCYLAATGWLVCSSIACKVVSADASLASGLESCDEGCTSLDSSSPTALSAMSAGTGEVVVPRTALSLCGMGTCLPDDRTACADWLPPGLEENDSSPTSSSSPSDAGTLDGVETSQDAGLGSSQDAGALGTGPPFVDSGFAPATPSNDKERVYSCQLRFEAPESETAVLSRGCGVSGSQDMGEACSSAIDCAPGLGCVGDAESARCLPYCCGLDSPCNDDSYCTHSPLYDELSTGTPVPLIPVCEPVDGCSLSEPFPCSEGKDCSCGPGEACTVVRADGATACTVPSPNGQGEGEDCPCMAGFICSQSEDGGSCRRLCQLDDSEERGCSEGLCQITGGLPSGWGTCVGGPAPE